MTRAAAALLMALALAGCQEGGEVAVTGNPAAPTFEFKPTGLFGGREIEVRAITVSHLVEGGPIPAESAWRVTGECTPVSRLMYGVAPAGLREEEEPAALQPDQLYSISFSGCGAVGGAFFTIIDGRIIAASGLGDRARQRVIDQSSL